MLSCTLGHLICRKCGSFNVNVVSDFVFGLLLRQYKQFGDITCYFVPNYKREDKHYLNM